MTTIIQISDFHIKSSMGKPENNSVFTDLVKAIELFKRDSGELIIVYNGDVIDNTNIYNKIQKLNDSTTLEEKITFWEERAKEEFELAKKYFEYMLDKLDITSKRLIICCGNHDVNTWYSTNEKKIDCPWGNDRSFSQKRFDCFTAFLKDLGIPKARMSQTFFASIDGFNFLVANSNWLNKFQWENCLCIDCKSINDTINRNKNDLFNAYRANPYRNIFVAHAPISDYCEEAKYRFEKNNQSPTMDIVDDLFGLQLFGDKHTGHAKGAEHIVGAPLDSETITCVAHQFSDNDLYFYRTLTYTKENRWEMSATAEYTQSILNVSEEYIKPRAKEYILRSQFPTILQALKSFELIRVNPIWKSLNMLLRASSRVREPAAKGSGKLIPIGLDYINTLTRLVTASTQRMSITVRGGMRLGKSVCMSMLYLNMLHRFSCGTFDYIPVYLNLEILLQEINTREGNRDSKEYLDEVIGKVSAIFQKSRELCETYHYDACCIIDGLNQYCYYRNAKIDNAINALLNKEENKFFKRCIFCIDTDSPKQLEYTDPHKRKDSQYIVYFDPILTYKINAQERYDGFLNGYCGLKGLSGDEIYEAAKLIKKRITNMGILKLDTNMMSICWEELSVPSSSENYFSILEKYVQSKISDINDMVTKASYLYSVEGRGYSEIKKKCSIDNETFDLIRTQPSIAVYLLARHYVETLVSFDTDPSQIKAIPAKSCLNQLLDHEMCSLVREYINANNLANSLLEFADKYYTLLMPSGRATLTYLVGRLNLSHEEIKERLDKQEGLLLHFEKENAENGVATDNYTRVAKRSITLSRIFNSANTTTQQKSILDYVHQLISNENERKINRRFHLQFYGDRPNNESSLSTDKIFDGFDMYCTYHILCQRIKEQTKSPERQRLLCLELFTLCDLIQIRIDNPLAYTSKDEETDSFFYNSKYNMPNDTMARDVIMYVQRIVQSYLNPFVNNQDELFIEYLEHQLDIYAKILPKLEKGPLSREDDRYKPEQCLQELTKLEETKRMGWLFPEKYKTIKKGTFLKKRNGDKCYETTLHHVYEMFLIGMLYLPKESDNEQYDKGVVLDLVLVHDLGEAHTGDSIKAYEFYEEDKKKEKEWCRNLFLQGVHEGIADLTDYGKLLVQWNTPNNLNYNVMVAKDLDRLQLLYKLSILLTQESPRNKVHFSKNRFLDFWDLRMDIQTNEVIRIFNLLIAQNSAFVEIVKSKYEVQVTVLRERFLD